MALSPMMLKVLDTVHDKNGLPIDKVTAQRKVYWRDLRNVQALKRRDLIRDVQWDEDALQGRGSWSFYLKPDAIKIRNMVDPFLIEHLSARGGGLPDMSYLADKFEGIF